MSIFVKPLIRIVEILFLKILSFVINPGIAVIILSLVINVILLPFYLWASKIEKKEKDIQNKMKPKLDEFKSVYRGYELHLYIKNVYRLNNYRPYYALRGLVGLLVQIPFFIAAYTYLSTFPGFDSVSFIGISNLAQPDGILKLGGSINILPFLMTLFNLASGYVYSKEMLRNEKITIFIISLFFLVLLYNSPSSLLIYWTVTNIFSLLKNLIQSKFELQQVSEGGN